MHSPRTRIGLPVLAVAILAAAALVAVAPAAEDNAYVVHNIISNVPGAARIATASTGSPIRVRGECIAASFARNPSP